MKDMLHRSFDKNIVCYIVIEESETFMTEQMGNVRYIAGDKVIDANDIVPFHKKAITEMRTEETGTSGDNANGFLHCHSLHPDRCYNR